MSDSFGLKAMGNIIMVAEYGQPTKSAGGIEYPDFGDMGPRYKQMDGRFGEVVSLGSGVRRKNGTLITFEQIGLKVGDVVVFSKRWGAKLRIQHDHPRWGKLWIRALDPNQVVGVVDGFEPWWNPAEAQIDPDGVFNG